MPQGHYDTMVSQICNRLKINFLVFSLSPGDLVAYKFFDFYRTTVNKQLNNVRLCYCESGNKHPSRRFGITINSAINYLIVMVSPAQRICEVSGLLS